MRTVKPPDIRRREIVEAAADLFLTKGYQKTSIKDITTHAGIARGLFHYYFKSKDEILAAVVVHLSTRLIESINTDALFAGCRDAVAKINLLMKLILGYELHSSALMSDFRTMSDTALRDGVAFGIIEAAVKIGVGFIHEGNRQGLFDCQHPQEVAEIFSFGMMLHFKKMLADSDQPPEPLAERFFKERREIYRGMAMRLLGMTEPHGLFEITEEWQ